MTLSNLIFILLVWVSNNTDYQISKFDYSVNVIDKKIIQEKVCNGKCPIIAYFDANQGVLIAKGNLEDAKTPEFAMDINVITPTTPAA